MSKSAYDSRLLLLKFSEWLRKRWGFRLGWSNEQ